jgi:hypothetical protein
MSTSLRYFDTAIVAETDTIAPIGPALRVADRAPKSQLHHVRNSRLSNRLDFFREESGSIATRSPCLSRSFGWRFLVRGFVGHEDCVFCEPLRLVERDPFRDTPTSIFII